MIINFIHYANHVSYSTVGWGATRSSNIPVMLPAILGSRLRGNDDEQCPEGQTLQLT